MLNVSACMIRSFCSEPSSEEILNYSKCPLPITTHLSYLLAAAGLATRAFYKAYPEHIFQNLVYSIHRLSCCKQHVSSTCGKTLDRKLAKSFSYNEAEKENRSESLFRKSHRRASRRGRCRCVHRGRRRGATQGRIQRQRLRLRLSAAQSPT